MKIKTVIAECTAYDFKLIHEEKKHRTDISNHKPVYDYYIINVVIYKV